MGQPLSIENATDSPIRVEWWTAGWGFKVDNYTIGARQTRDVKNEAVWYEIKVVEQDGKFIDGQFYGGSGSNWRWDGQRLRT